MSVNPTCQTLRDLIEQIKNKLPDADKYLVQELKQALNKLSLTTDTTTQSSAPVMDKSSGCYVFAEDPAFFCPHCFDKTQQRIPTQRLNRKLRVCPQCRSSLRPLD